MTFFIKNFDIPVISITFGIRKMLFQKEKILCNTLLYSLDPQTKKSGASPKSGDIAFGARTALNFNGHFHYVAIFEKR